MILLLALAAAFANAPEFAGRLFAPGTISTSLAESGGTFSRDGSEFYFTVRTPSTTTVPVAVICFAKLRHGRWSKPEVVPFSGHGFDYAPALSPDGRVLVFTSARSPRGGPRLDNTDLWIVQRGGDGRWRRPRRLPAPINSDNDEQGASIGPDGALYFSSDRPGRGGADIYRAEPDGTGRWKNPIVVDAVSGAFTETQPFISADGKLLFFVSLGRAEDLIARGAPYPRGDIWVSRLMAGAWTVPRPLGRAVNTPASETYPFLSPDGKRFYFTSEMNPAITPMSPPMSDGLERRIRGGPFNGTGNIYWLPVEAISELRP